MSLLVEYLLFPVTIANSGSGKKGNQSGDVMTHLDTTNTLMHAATLLSCDIFLDKNIIVRRVDFEHR